MGGTEGGHGGGKNDAADPFQQTRPLAELSVPAAYDATKGWDETLNRVPTPVGTLPVTEAPHTGVVALMHVASNGYTIKVRAADTADASARGTAGELVLALYGRIPVDDLKLDGDRRLLDLLLAWDPDEQDVTLRHLARPRVCLPRTATSTPWCRGR